MEDYGLDLHSSMILEEYRERLPQFEQLKTIIVDQLYKIIKNSGIEINTIEARVKTEASFAGKLQRKGHKYHSLDDITDVVGARIITFYNEDVDRIASMIETQFEVDWTNSVDKRKMHQVSSFGYNSLHYVCRLRREFFHDEQCEWLNEVRFEIQMRTALQHVWSAIEHDTGYKNEIEVPAEYVRNLSRLSGLLELADNEFSRLRQEIADYRRRAQSLVQKGRLDDVALDGDTFRTFMAQQPFSRLNKKIAAITQAEIHEVSAMPYLPVLLMLNMKTLGDVMRFVKECSDDAYQLALHQLGNTDIDILSSTIGLQNLCIVKILKDGYGKIGLIRFLDKVYGKSEHNPAMADMFFNQAKGLSFMA